MDDAFSVLAKALDVRRPLGPVNWADRGLEYAAEGVVSVRALRKAQEGGSFGLLAAHDAVHHYEILWTRLARVPIEKIDERQWREWYRRIPDIVATITCLHRGVSINVESAHVLYEPLWREIRRTVMLLEHELGVHTTVEWTERHYPGIDIRMVGDRFCRLRDDFGVAVHLDDIGSSGVDALARAMLVSPDAVKIDGALFQSAREDGWAFAALRSHVRTYHEMMVSVVAEWTETPEDIDLAESIGVDYLQGWCFNDAGD